MIWITGKVHTSFADYLTNKDIPFGVITDCRVRKTPSNATQIMSLQLGDEAVLETELRNLPIPDVTAVTVAGYENYIVPAAYITTAYNLPGLSVAAAKAATDKTLMRQAFQAYDPSITPQYAEVTSWSDIALFMQSHNFPVMLKPASLMKSLLISKSTNRGELERNFKELATGIQRAYDQQSVSQTPKMLIEEFLEGSMHTVAGFVDAKGDSSLLPQIVDCVRASDINVADSYLYSRHLPSKLSAEDQAAILLVADKGVKALKLTSCPVHIEIILTKTGPKIIEIGARTGGYRPKMYQSAYGIDMFQGVIDTAYDRPVKIATNRSAQIVVLELFPETIGMFKELHNEALVAALPSLERLTIRARPGSAVGAAQSGYKAAAIIILSSDNAKQIAADYQTILDSVHVVIA